LIPPNGIISPDNAIIIPENNITVARSNLLYKALAEVRNVGSKNARNPENLVTFEGLLMLFKPLFKN
jgi:hypothetical protein